MLCSSNSLPRTNSTGTEGNAVSNSLYQRPSIGSDDIRDACVVIPDASATIWALSAQSNADDTAQRIPITDQPFSVGRHSSNTLAVANSTVSGRHAELILAGDKLLVRDCGSTNGTLVNGRTLHGVEELKHSDILHFGSAMYVVDCGSMPAGRATFCADNAGETLAQVQFTTLLERPGVQSVYQPIVDLHQGTHIGYEILSRSQFVGLETPAKMFRVAAQRTSEAELSRVCRLEGLRGAAELDLKYQLYLNTHPAELGRPELLESVRKLRNLYPAQEIVLEVHESSVTSIEFLRGLREALTDLNIGLAYDDFGAGQARLMELIEVPPDVLKFDVQLIQGLPTASESRRTTVASLIRLVRDLNVTPLAEGVETEEEAGICSEMGFELAQGFLFGRGEPASCWVHP